MPPVRPTAPPPCRRPSASPPSPARRSATPTRHPPPSPGPPAAVRSGATLVELVVALAVAAVLAAIGVRGAARAYDGAAVHAAGAELRGAFAAARALAALRGARVAVRLDSAAGTAVVHAADDTLRRLPLAAQYGVRLTATRDSMTYAPPGLGVGAANLRVTLTRGAAAETVTVSRLGRVR